MPGKSQPVARVGAGTKAAVGTTQHYDIIVKAVSQLAALLFIAASNFSPNSANSSAARSLIAQ